MTKVSNFVSNWSVTDYWPCYQVSLHNLDLLLENENAHDATLPPTIITNPQSGLAIKAEGGWNTIVGEK